MGDSREELKKATGNYANPQPNDGSDEHLDEMRKNRGYNPLDQAEKATVSEKLNQDSGKYRQGPGPF